jgi:parallel beta-helix repeat protein
MRVGTMLAAAAVLAALLLSGGLILGAGTARAATTLAVSPTGADSATCGAAASPCLTISQAVTNAAAGDTIEVAAGTYTEQVTITKSITLQGTSAIIDASGLVNGVAIQPGGDGSTVSGFTIENALAQGLVAQQVSGVTISGNTIQGNDLGAHTDVTPFCMDQGPVPGDCGEGLHLLSTTNSTVDGNHVEGNAGGILVTDEFGPSANNVISNNVVVNNQEDCGITLAAHSDQAWDAGTALYQQAGIYGNRVEGNTVTGNGAGGVGLYASAPGTATYNNVVVNNAISGNGSAGVQMHAHAPNQSLDSNQITGNVIDTNNVVGDPDSGVFETAGILIDSPVIPVIGTVIADNQISNNTFGIWLAANIDTSMISDSNTFTNVTTPQQQAAAPAMPPPAAAGSGVTAQGSSSLPGNLAVLLLAVVTIGLAGVTRARATARQG